MTVNGFEDVRLSLLTQLVKHSSKVELYFSNRGFFLFPQFSVFRQERHPLRH